jgi:hypothetical protein
MDKPLELLLESTCMLGALTALVYSLARLTGGLRALARAFAALVSNPAPRRGAPRRAG